MKNFLVVLALLVGCDGSGVDTLPDSGSLVKTTVNTVVESSTATHTSTAPSTDTMTYVITNVVSNPGQPTQTQTSIGTKLATAVETVTTTTTSTATVTGIDTASVFCTISGTTQYGWSCFLEQGVYADMGANPCNDFSKHPECKTGSCCWNPLSGSCTTHIVVVLSPYGPNGGGSHVNVSVCDGSDTYRRLRWCAELHTKGAPAEGTCVFPPPKSLIRSRFRKPKRRQIRGLLLRRW